MKNNFLIFHFKIKQCKSKIFQKSKIIEMRIYEKVLKKRNFFRGIMLRKSKFYKNLNIYSDINVHFYIHRFDMKRTSVTKIKIKEVNNIVLNYHYAI